MALKKKGFKLFKLLLFFSYDMITAHVGSIGCCPWSG
uniref:Uncharacterized protein n=1 Tax=Anguilla anguilla TaxID=7936 RepID=A0A0E9WQZ4_ANGAN